MKAVLILKPKVFNCSQVAYAAQHFLNTMAEVECLALQFQPAGLDLADVQNLIDQFQEMSSIVKNVADEPVLLFIERAFQLFREQLRETDNRVQRRTQFMAHAGKELILEAVRLFDLEIAGLQLLILGRQLSGILLAQHADPVLDQLPFRDVTH